MKDFTPEERAEVKARTAALIKQELARRDLRQMERIDASVRRAGARRAKAAHRAD
jgi:hypothetical protein